MPIDTGFMSRRSFLKASAAAGLSALSPVVVFRAQAAAGPGELLMAPVEANPAGAVERLFLLKGDPLSGPIRAIVTEEGNPVPAPTLPAGERRVLRLMHFNDMHNHITDMHAARGDTHRLSQMVRKVRQARADAKDNEIVLFVSVGDDHTGSVFDELTGWSPEEFVVDPAYRAYSAAGVDIAVLGNHEFDRGAELLKVGLKRDARFPVLSANVHGSQFLARDEDYVCAAVAEAKGLRIGFIGLTTAVDTRVGQPSDPTLAVASPVEAVRNVLPAVAEISDVVVILSHCGFGSGSHRSGKAGAARMIGEGDLDIAAAAGPLTDKPVVLLGGHSHTKLNGEGIDVDNVVEGVLITQAEANGKFLGDIAMSIAAESGRKAWFSSVGLHAIKQRDDRVKADDPKYAGLEHDGDYDADFEAEHVLPLIKALDSKLAEQIGTVEDGALVSTERTIADRYIREVAIANFMNDALVDRSATFPGGPIDIALFNATGLTAGVAEGPLSFKAWYDVMPYADNVHVATMTGAQILDMLDNNAKRVVRPEELAAGGIDLTQFVSRGFLHFSRTLRYRIDFGASAAEARAADVTIDGTPIDQLMDKSFKVAFNTYISLGGFGEAWNGKPISGGVPGDIPSMDMRQLDYDHTGLVYRNEIIAHIRTIGTVSPATGALLDGRLVSA
ncbi:bifunctional metallophosphatase/5'-nucleotidase [Polymorphum gilvum]|uniref:Ser/Thr protein phosphatase family protein n=1 Tax=Polymorphum gilvum (strain LMG 25793 / CGMCC 1.9160 / SL003B-26A1) TaxID=991905 RepID=F2IUZ4_POLGS|nr:5'-nucleotidase C-terminal domain-containing protein [Polymorphum gilvum]ADZ70223.1 Ser/Thr protein phosphatase family protein [Polymorphum gilvum SL003B-26A1]